MQTVSQEWNNNQNATIRCAGYVEVTLGEGSGSLTIPTARIKNVSHVRSYDPMSFELPTNNITIDIFNYDDFYTPYYEDYTDERIKITVKYGYALGTGNETIPGGVFYTKDITNSDGIFTLSGSSSLEAFDEESEIQYVPPTGVFQIWEGTASEVVYTETEDNNLQIKFSEILQTLESGWDIDIQSNTAFDELAAYAASVSGKRNELLQKMCNGALQMCTIGREDAVHILNRTSSQPQAGNHVKLLNCLGKPVYTSCKKVKAVDINALLLDNCEVKHYEQSNRAQSTFTVDMSTEIFKSAKVSLGTMNTITRWGNDYILAINASGNPSTRTYELETYVITDSFATDRTAVNDTGEICDIANDVLYPVSVQKVINYFANRKLYEFNVRGNPARDVGDYIWVSLTDDADETSYLKGLVLESELIYDGSFKENLTVRIIETEFETEESDAV